MNTGRPLPRVGTLVMTAPRHTITLFHGVDSVRFADLETYARKPKLTPNGWVFTKPMPEWLRILGKAVR